MSTTDCTTVTTVATQKRTRRGVDGEIDASLFPLPKVMRSELADAVEIFTAILADRVPTKRIPYPLKMYILRRRPPNAVTPKTHVSMHARADASTVWVPTKNQLFWLRFIWPAFRSDPRCCCVSKPAGTVGVLENVDAKLMTTKLADLVVSSNDPSTLSASPNASDARMDVRLALGRAAHSLFARLVELANELKSEPTHSSMEIVFDLVGSGSTPGWLCRQTKGSGINMSTAALESVLPVVVERFGRRYAHLFVGDTTDGAASGDDEDEGVEGVGDEAHRGVGSVDTDDEDDDV